MSAYELISKIVHFKLANPVVVEVKLFDLFEVIHEFHLGEFIVVEFKDLNFLENAKL